MTEKNENKISEQKVKISVLNILYIFFFIRYDIIS